MNTQCLMKQEIRLLSEKLKVINIIIIIIFLMLRLFLQQVTQLHPRY
jgi:hypothetical protein